MTQPPPGLNLTESQQWAINHALELEEGGWLAAALYLRKRHFPSLPWDDPRPHGVSRRGFEAMLRLHHGSNPPLSEFAHAPKTPVHHAAHPAQPFTPAPRADQTIA